MWVFFRDRRYDLNPPVAADGELALAVDRFVCLSLPAEARKHQFEYGAVLRKALFFLLREGPALTWRKIFSTRLQRMLVHERSLVVAIGRLADGKMALAVGPQWSVRTNYFVFPEELVVPVASPHDADLLATGISRYLSQRPDLRAAFFHYSPFSGKEVPIQLDRALETSRSQAADPGVTFETPLPVTVEPTSARRFSKQSMKSSAGRPPLFLFGAGVYAKTYILPNLKRLNCYAVADLNPILAAVIGEEFSFRHRFIRAEQALERLQDVENPRVVIATYHSTHVQLADEALRRNRGALVFIEKPPVTTFDQLQRLLELREGPHFVEIGYNRRHVPFVSKARAILEGQRGPITMTCIVKELNIPRTHWYYWPRQGSRIVGNLSHWIDLGVYFIQRRPESLICISGGGDIPTDEISTAVLFPDGSLFTLVASDRGNPLRGVQEYIEIRKGDVTVVIEDFIKMRVLKGGRQQVWRKLRREKGHARMCRDFETRCRTGEPAGYPQWDLETSSRIYLSLTESLTSGVQRFDFAEACWKTDEAGQCVYE
jgi:predicted dehydrogenase